MGVPRGSVRHTSCWSAAAFANSAAAVFPYSICVCRQATSSQTDRK